MLSLLYSPALNPYITTRKTIALTRWTFISKVMSLLFNMLSRLVIAFLPRSKHLLNTQISKHNQSIKVLWWGNAHLFFPFDFMYALLNYLHTKYFLFLILKLKIIFRDTDEIVKRLSCLYFGKTRFLVTAILYTFLDEKSILYMIVILQ